MNELLDTIGEIYDDLDRQIEIGEDEISNARSCLENSESQLYDAKRSLGRFSESLDRLRSEANQADDGYKKAMLDFLRLIVNLDEYGVVAYDRGQYIPRMEWGTTISNVEKKAVELYQDLKDSDNA